MPPPAKDKTIDEFERIARNALHHTRNSGNPTGDPDEQPHRDTIIDGLALESLVIVWRKMWELRQPEPATLTEHRELVNYTLWEVANEGPYAIDPAKALGIALDRMLAERVFDKMKLPDGSVVYRLLLDYAGCLKYAKKLARRLDMHRTALALIDKQLMVEDDEATTAGK